MEDLIKALTILLKYENNHNPTYCSFGEFIVDVDYDLVSQEDKQILEDLGFYKNDTHTNTGFISYRFGSNY